MGQASILLFVALLLGAASCPERPTETLDVNQVFANLKLTSDILFTPFAKAQKTPPAIVVGVFAEGGSRVFSYGQMSKTKTNAPDENTIFMIGSVQKLFAGLLFAILLEQKKVTLEQSVRTLLPADKVTVPTYQGTAITLQDLATFTSGLPDSAPSLTAAIRAAKMVNEINTAQYNFLNHFVLTRKPGTVYEYSNISAALLANVLARVENKPYGQVIQEQILTPLGMTSTGTQFNFALAGRLAPGYNSTTGAARPSPATNALSQTGSPQMFSTVKDMMVFGQLHLGLKISNLTAAAKSTLVPRFQNTRPNQQTAFFWQVTNGHRYFKNGLTNRYGYSSVIVLNTKTNSGVVVLSNTTSQEIDSMGVALNRALATALASMK